MRCSGCGRRVRKRVRAVVVRDDLPPRMGLVCEFCARCGVLVVPATLRMLPPKPRRVSRSALLAGPRKVVVPPLVPDVRVEPRKK